MAIPKREKLGARRKTCNRCNTGDLAWHNLDGVWKLYEGKEEGGRWTPNLDKPHLCAGIPGAPGGPGGGVNAGPATDDVALKGTSLTPLVCDCHVKVWMREVDVLAAGYPICSKCQTYYQIAGPAEVAALAVPYAFQPDAIMSEAWKELFKGCRVTPEFIPWDGV